MTIRRPFLLTACALLLAAASARAEVGYVRDVVIINLRTRPDNISETIGLMRTGTRMELLKESGEYYYVRLEDGTEGWVQKQYVSNDPPASARLAQMEEEVGRLKRANEELEAKLAKARGTRTEASWTAEIDKLKTDYAALQEKSGRAIEIAVENERLAADNKRLIEEADELRDELSASSGTQTIKWFLAGAAAILLGWFLGIISWRKKRNRLWA